MIPDKDKCCNLCTYWGNKLPYDDRRRYCELTDEVTPDWYRCRYFSGGMQRCHSCRHWTGAREPEGGWLPGECSQLCHLLGITLKGQDVGAQVAIQTPPHFQCERFDMDKAKARLREAPNG